MYLRLLLIFILVPFVEMVLLIIFGKVTDWYVPILFIIITGLAGSWLARTQGMSIYRRIRHDLQHGHMPTDAMIEGALIFIAGMLLVTPGVLTDLLGLSALVPPVRVFYRQQLVDWFHRTFEIKTIVAGEGVSRSGVVDSYVVERDRLDQRDDLA